VSVDCYNAKMFEEYETAGKVLKPIEDCQCGVFKDAQNNGSNWRAGIACDMRCLLSGF
jgi:hypothetical protein